MASEFIGFTILVTIQNPPGAQIRGVVSNVVNQKLYLHDVVLLWTGQKLTSYVLDSSVILDLEIAPATTYEPDDLPTPIAPKQHASTIPFVDPAILSFSKPSQGAQIPVSPVMIASGEIQTTPVPSQKQNLKEQRSKASLVNEKRFDRRDSTATATLTEPFDALALDDKKKAVSLTAPGIIDMKDVNNGPLKSKKASKGKGWRQTPLIEEVPRQGRKQRGRKAVEDVNGWATEDATDIQDLGDFDFESNLNKFDKRRVFDDIRKDDTTADDDRLVSFNRKPKAGTNGGRNLHFTENVLDLPDVRDTSRWKSEAGETEDDMLDGPYSSGRGSRRAGSRRPVQSRKGSVIPGLLDRKDPSPRPLTRMSTASPLHDSLSGIRASFRMNNNKPCHCISPLQMLEVEQLCITELGLTEDMLSENSGRSVAEAILRTGEVKNVLFLVGNHKSGARAIAAARHLRNRRLRVTVSILGGDRDDSLLEVVRRQMHIYKKGMGYVERWDDYQSKLSDGGPMPDLIVDALLGIHVAFDELRTDDQATAFEMIKWANRGTPTLSVDVPSGISAASGVVAEVDGLPLSMTSKHVVCLGAPKTGLLHAMASDLENAWQVTVADIGISTAAWQRNGSRRKQGIDFGNEWLISVKLVLA